MNAVKNFLLLIPITFVTILFVGEQDLHKYTKDTCYGLAVYLFVFLILYFLLLQFNCNKWIGILVAFTLWVTLNILRKKYL